MVQREAKRFDLTLPCELTRRGAEPVSHRGKTQNIGSNGVVVALEAQLEIGDTIEYIIQLPTGSPLFSVQIRCVGKVVHFANAALAATLERYEFSRLYRRAATA